MSDFAFDELTEPQIAALSDVAFGGNGAGVGRRTSARLVALGMIVPVKRHGRDAIGTYTWTEYAMPIHVHIQFCEWCSLRTEGGQ